MFQKPIMSRGGGVIEINGSSDYNTQLAKAGKKLVVVDFYATWCGPVRILSNAFPSTFLNFIL